MVYIPDCYVRFRRLILALVFPVKTNTVQRSYKISSALNLPVRNDKHPVSDGNRCSVDTSRSPLGRSPQRR